MQNGNFLGRIGTMGTLNSPWGLAIAPSGFGSLAGDLLVGNFGDGRINIFSADPNSPAFLGQLTDAKTGNPLSIDGLWGLIPGNGTGAGNMNDIYFTAGPNDESGGVLGVASISSGAKFRSPGNDLDWGDVGGLGMEEPPAQGDILIVEDIRSSQVRFDRSARGRGPPCAGGSLWAHRVHFRLVCSLRMSSDQVPNPPWGSSPKSTETYGSVLGAMLSPLDQPGRSVREWVGREDRSPGSDLVSGFLPDPGPPRKIKNQV